MVNMCVVICVWPLKLNNSYISSLAVIGCVVGKNKREMQSLLRYVRFLTILPLTCIDTLKQTNNNNSNKKKQ